MWARYGLAFACIVAILATCARAGETAADARDTDASLVTNVRNLTPEAEYLRDPSGRLTLENVRADTRFLPARTERLRFGYTRDVIWIRFHLRNENPESRLYYLDAASPVTEDLRVWYLDENGKVLRTLELGTRLPFSKRPIADRNFMLPVRLKAGEVRRVYLRLYSARHKSPALLLYAPRAYQDHVYRSHLLRGAYFGLLFTALSYSLLLFFSIKDRVFLIYSAYVLAIGLYVSQVTGYNYQFLWPEWVEWNLIASSVVGALMIGMGAAFCLSFLNLREIAPRLHRAFIVFISGAILVAPVTRILPIPGLLNLVAIVGCGLVAWAGWSALASGYRPARYFLLAFAALLSFGVVYALGQRGYAVLGELSERALEIGTSLEVMILSLGIGDRINVVREKNRRLELQARDREAERHRLEMEMSVAGRIQQSLLPTGVPSVPGLRVAARYVPAAAVGGDFYDFFTDDAGRVVIVIADVSGHGVPAALVAAMFKMSAAHSAALAPRPREFFQSINQAMVERRSHDGDHYVTAGAVVLDPRGRAIECCLAGHPGILRVREGSEIEEILTDGIILGIFPEVELDSRTLDLRAGDRIFLYTDGITEAQNRVGELFGKERLRTTLLETAHLPVESACDELLLRVEAWSDGIYGDDDRTFVMVDYVEE